MADVSPPQHTSLQRTPTSASWTNIAFVGGLVFICSLAGIWARPMGFLSAIWPANTALLGTLLHKPHWVRPGTAMAAFVAYITADLLTGSSPDVAILLSTANMLGVASAWWLMHKRASATLFMQRQSSALLLFMGSGLAAFVAAAMGAPVLAASFNTPLWQAFSMWFSSEWFNYMVFLPVILSWPTRKIALTREPSSKTHRLLRAMPMLSVVALEVLSYWLGGPGALAFSLPALLWSALTYRVFTLTLITATLCLSKIVAITLGSFDFTPAHFLDVVSFRLGLSMLILGPLAVAGSHLARTELMRKLSHAVNHDFLTDVLARSAFLSQGQRILKRCAHNGEPIAVFMLDLDHFKQVNDRFGHAAGDELLRAFSQTLTQVLRAQDIVGRIGGEEFAMVLSQLDKEASLEIAERINQATRELQLPTEEGIITATVSIGLVHISSPGQHQSLDALLQQADQALYNAKSSGFKAKLW